MEGLVTAELFESPALEPLERMNLVVVGHVDHGKSTVVGRLLADTDSLPEGKLEQVRERCLRSGKQFEYAFLLDALADEQAQGITIDAARIFFKTDQRYYILIDAPGHIEFLKNMVTGASHADAALLVIDAHEGVQENSRRHGYMLSLLGVRHVVVLINKMDLVGYSEETFNRVSAEYRAFLSELQVQPLEIIPVSALDGDNIASRSEAMPWYAGPTVLESLDSLPLVRASAEANLRLFVQDVYKFTAYGDARRIIAGTIDAGSVTVGDELVFYPSGKRSKVASLERFSAPQQNAAGAGEAIGLTLAEQIYVQRGELATRASEARPQVTTRLRASVFWLGNEPLKKNKNYTFRLGTAKVTCRVEQILSVLDAGKLEREGQAGQVERNEVAECVLKLNKAIAFDEVEFLRATSRFVVIDNFRIAGGGIVREAMTDERSALREKALVREKKWIRSLVSPADRANRYAQRPVLLLITGPQQSPRKEVAKALEARLFLEGKIVYFLGIGSMVHGLDADITDTDAIPKTGARQEHIRRLAELSIIMLDAGMLCIVSAAELTQSDLAIIHELVGEENVKTVWFGDDGGDQPQIDLQVPSDADFTNAVDQIKELLYENSIIFRPW